MPPPARRTRRGYATILQDSPLLSTERAKALFPTAEDRRALQDLAQALDESIAKNESIARKWKSLSATKETALKLIGEALGRLVPGL